MRARTKTSLGTLFHELQLDEKQPIQSNPKDFKVVSKDEKNRITGVWSKLNRKLIGRDSIHTLSSYIHTLNTNRTLKPSTVNGFLRTFLQL